MWKKIFKALLAIGIIYLGIYFLRVTSVIKTTEYVSRLFFPNEHYVGKMVSADLTPRENDHTSYRVLFIFKLTFYRVREFDNLLLVDVNNSIPGGNLGWKDTYEGFYTYLKKIPRYKRVVRKLDVPPDTYVLIILEKVDKRIIQGIRIAAYILIFLGIYLIYDLTLRRVVRL